jgi:hypothetical protein
LFKYDRDKCGLFTHKSVPVIFEPPCVYIYEVHTDLWWGDLRKKTHGRPRHKWELVKWITKKWDWEAWTGFIWLRTGTGWAVVSVTVNLREFLD